MDKDEDGHGEATVVCKAHSGLMGDVKQLRADHDRLEGRFYMFVVMGFFQLLGIVVLLTRGG